MIRKLVDGAAIVLVFLLMILTLVFKSGTLALAVLNSNTIMVNLLFLFACVVGVITWRENRHISLAALVERLPPAPRRIIRGVILFAVPLMLTALFTSALSATVTAFEQRETVLGIPLRAIFLVLSLAYLAMLIITVRRSFKPQADDAAAEAGTKADPYLALAGVLVGLVPSAGPIAGVLYATLGITPPVLDTLFNAWCGFASAATAPLVIVLIGFAFLGVPLFLVIAAITFVAFSQGGGYVEILPLEAYSILTDKSVAAIPLFTIAGYVLSRGSAGKRLVQVFHSWFGWLRGGIVVAAVIVTAFFTTFTGVSGTTILALGPLLLVILTGAGYPEDRARSLITSSGALGLLFPPSMAIIVYGTTNLYSVDLFDLFKGALIPGCIFALGMILLGIFYDKKGGRSPFSFPDAKTALKDSSFELLLPLFICIGFFTGFFTLTEAASFAVLYTIVLETYLRKDFTIRAILPVIAESLPVSGGVLFILASARGLSYFFMDANIPALVSDLVLSVLSSKYVFLMLLNGVLFLVGCLMDTFSAIMIVSPLVIPIAESFGINPVHTGVIFLMNMQIGFLTPPVGMDLFIASYTFGIPVFKIVRGILPFLLTQVIILFLITYVPWFSTVLL
jgi:tripartite ATP-independent transporter DctM subunit